MAKVLLKKSSVGDNAPGTGDLEYGEVAINYADGRLYYKNSSNQIKNFIDSDLLDATYIRSVLDDPSPELAANLEIHEHRITNDTYGSGSYIGLQEYYTGDSAQQMVIASRQDVNIIVDTNNGSGFGAFNILANDSDVNTAPTFFSVNETGAITAYGNINFYGSGSNITNLATPVDSADASTKQYVDSADNLKLDKSGGTMSGILDMGGYTITALPAPAIGSDATNKTYVDDAIAAGVGSINFPVGDYGSVDSVAQVDAFGYSTSNTVWDMLTTPTNDLPVVDLNS